MAQLFRMVNHQDGVAKSQTFTFILPKEVVHRDAPLVCSREFSYGGHRWQMEFTKSERHFCPTLNLMSLTPGMTCTCDVVMSLINRESFTRNQVYVLNSQRFNSMENAVSKPKFMTIEEMIKLKFTSRNYEFLFELTLKNLRTTYRFTIRLLPPMNDRAARSIQSKFDHHQYETDNFHFGNSDWFATFSPNVALEPCPMHLLQLQRRQVSDQLCKLKYAIHFGDLPRPIQSGEKIDLVDFNGKAQGWYFPDNYLEQSSNMEISLLVELKSLSYLTVVHAHARTENDQPVTFKDRDLQLWSARCVEIEPKITFRVTYDDILKIPSTFLRYASFKVYFHTETYRHGVKNNSVDRACSKPQFFERYFSRLDADDNELLFDCNIPAEELARQGTSWRHSETGKLIMTIEWKDTYLLYHAGYHQHDDILKRHLYQIRREVQTLQNENSQLEKELHNYQVTIATKCSSGETAPIAQLVSGPNVQRHSPVPPPAKPSSRQASTDSQSNRYRYNSRPVSREEYYPCDVRVVNTYDIRAHDPTSSLPRTASKKRQHYKNVSPHSGFSTRSNGVSPTPRLASFDHNSRINRSPRSVGRNYSVDQALLTDRMEDRKDSRGPIERFSSLPRRPSSGQIGRLSALSNYSQMSTEWAKVDALRTMNEWSKTDSGGSFESTPRMPMNNSRRTEMVGNGKRMSATFDYQHGVLDNRRSYYQ